MGPTDDHRSGSDGAADPDRGPDPAGAERSDPSRALSGPGRSRPALPDRPLDPDDVERILRRASRRELTAVPGPDRPSVADLMAAADDVGLDPGEVRRAAALEPPTSVGPVARGVFGAPDRREVHAFLPDTGLPEARHALVTAVEQGLGRRGQVLESAPGLFVWQEDHTLGRTRLELRAVDDGTDLTLTTDRAGHFAAAWFLGLVAWAVAWSTLSLGALVGPLGTAASLIVLPLLLPRPFWVRSDRALRRRLDDTALRVLRVVDEDGRTRP